MRYVCNECSHEQFVPTKPIVAIDVDGTLADYHRHFLRFAEEYTGVAFPEPYKINPGKPLHEFMGLSKPEYDQVKFSYRRGGMKRNMPVFDNASEMTHAIKDMGCEVWIATTRPADRYDNVDPDTREWLRRNNIHYDALIFDSIHGDDKYHRLADIVGPDSVLAILDDLPEMVYSAKSAGFPNLFMKDQPYNRYTKAEAWSIMNGVDRIDDLMDFADQVKIILDNVEHWGKP